MTPRLPDPVHAVHPPAQNQPRGAAVNDPIAALIAAHRAIAEQARADGDPGRANLHDWAADQAQHFREEQNR